MTSIKRWIFWKKIGLLRRHAWLLFYLSLVNVY